MKLKAVISQFTSSGLAGVPAVQLGNTGRDNYSNICDSSVYASLLLHHEVMAKIAKAILVVHDNLPNSC